MARLMAAGPGSAYGGSQHGTSFSGGKKSAARPEVVPVPNHGQVAGASSDHNLAVNQDTGEVLDDDTAESMTTVTTTTTTTTRTIRGWRPGVSPAQHSSQAMSSSDGSYFAGTPGHSSSKSGSQTRRARSPSSAYTTPEQEQLPVSSQHVGQKVQAGHPAVPDVVVNDRPVSPRPGSNFNYLSRQVVPENNVDDGRAGSPPILVPVVEPPTSAAAMRPHNANSTNSAHGVGRTNAVPSDTRWPNAAPSGTRREALEELKAAGKLAAPEAKSMLKSLEAFAVGKLKITLPNDDPDLQINPLPPQDQTTHLAHRINFPFYRFRQRKGSNCNSGIRVKHRAAREAKWKDNALAAKIESGASPTMTLPTNPSGAFVKLHQTIRA
ncbi:hypothetical protein EJ03DRAFT_10201 [Teratosphaeria nubilosa]|uniref:Uncharacterized protein n=1 Tax=Teratosphaeria nubilosa TaxID=161662 RepID=A0A6G1LFX8_9PEZI|nr:hypothetical protein EJ03DRAFT_10201 [Teratosphaeria nubilosa]